jgi:ectoine hydroxylase-related dioxygenase (phytanoyl-CoA dioxygenase family)
MHEVRTYGVSQRRKTSNGHLQAALEEFAFRGFLVLPNVLDASQVANLNSRLEAVYARQCEEVGGEEQLTRINDSDIARCPLAYDDTFMELAQHPKILEVAREILGPTFILMMQNGILNRADKYQFQTTWHRDLNYQHWVCSATLAISALVCLEEFTVETGATVVLPCSHKFAEFPSDEFVRSAEVSVIASAGSVIVMDAMTFHRAGVNRSRKDRRAVNHVLAVPILSQPVDIPAMLDRNPPQDPWLAGYFGYRWNPVRSVRDWRLRKIEEKAPTEHN